MRITDKQYKELSDKVYWLDPANNRYEPNMKVKSKWDFGDQEFKILKIQENSSSDGLQAMAVAPNHKGQVDLSEVVIAYAGTNTSDLKDLETDLRCVMDFYGKTASPGFSYDNSKARIAGQLESAIAFAEDVKSEYQKATITTTGHSLGEFLALYIAAENHWQNVGFNGPDPYDLLSPAAKNWIKQNPGMLTNYRNRADFIGNFGGNSTGAALYISMEMGLQNPLTYHDLAAWRFDRAGKLRIPKNEFNQQARLQQTQRTVFQTYDMKAAKLKRLQKSLKASGGGLSTNERIYLEDQQALLVVNTARQHYQLAMKNFIATYQASIENAEVFWSETLQLASAKAHLLAATEIIDNLAITGATWRQMVEEPREVFQEKIDQAQAMNQRFDLLTTEIKRSIAVLLEQDQQLAQQLN